MKLWGIDKCVKVEFGVALMLYFYTCNYLHCIVLYVCLCACIRAYLLACVASIYYQITMEI